MIRKGLPEERAPELILNDCTVASTLQVRRLDENGLNAEGTAMCVRSYKQCDDPKA